MYRISIYIIILSVLSGCATFYELNYGFQEKLQQGDYSGASKYLSSHKKLKKKRNELLYYMNLGYVQRQSGDYEASNKSFNQADYLIEDYKKELGYEALALFTNDAIKPYKPEPYEEVMIHYYKALNYLNIHQPNEALVEAKRLTLSLQKLTDYDPKLEKKLNQFVGFSNLITGIIYESNEDYNNAFIAYRNALNDYEKSKTIPDQLKKDLISSAYKSGFTSEAKMYEKKFGINVEPKQSSEIVFFWENGLNPFKDEWSVNFTIVAGQQGYVTFDNADLGISLPFFIGNNAQQRQDLLGLRFTRIAFPKYISRKPLYNDGKISYANNGYAFSEIIDINQVAHDWMDTKLLKYLSKSLLRVALKKIAELKLNAEHQALGSAANILNALTEKADTRNWQTLPAQISYTRFPVDKSAQSVDLTLYQGLTKKIETINVHPDRSLNIVSHHSLAVQRLYPR